MNFRKSKLFFSVFLSRKINCLYFNLNTKHLKMSYSRSIRWCSKGFEPRLKTWKSIAAGLFIQANHGNYLELENLLEIIWGTQRKKKMSKTKQRYEYFTSCMKIQHQTPSETLPETWFLLPTRRHPEIPSVEILQARVLDMFQTVQQLPSFYPVDCR